MNGRKFGRLLWLIYTVVCVGLFLWSMQTAPERRDLSIYSALLWSPVVHLIPSAIIIWRGNGDRLHLIAALMLVYLGVYRGTQTNEHITLVNYALDTVVTNFGFTTVCLFFFLFPNGRMVPHWMWWSLVLLVLPLGILNFFLPLSDPTALEGLAVGALLGAVTLGGVWAQVYRYRRLSTPAERQQAKWVVFAFVIWVLGNIVYALQINGVEFMQRIRPDGTVLQLLFDLVVSTALPLAILVAILRYRLWDIDLIIRRTLLYSLLSIILALTYSTVVFSLQTVSVSLFGQQSQLNIVLSTLLIAALFNPVRRRLQTGIDRRFFRPKYNAQRTLARFAGTVREEVDLDVLSAELLHTIRQTMQPTHISLWLPDDHRLKGSRD